MISGNKTLSSNKTIRGGVTTDEWYMWQVIFQTGSVLDYLRYKSIQDSKRIEPNAVNVEEGDEISNRWADTPGNEYR